MSVNEQIVTGRKFRKLLDEATKLWQRISFWTKATDVEFDDGQTAESKMGAIKGITTDLNVTETGYAADATMLTQLYSDITAPDETVFLFDYQNGKYGYNLSPERGADTFFPFSGDSSKYAGELYNAMINSGILSRNMTWDQMLDALYKKYPTVIDLRTLSYSNGGKMTHSGAIIGTMSLPAYSQTEPLSGYILSNAVSMNPGSTISCIGNFTLSPVNYNNSASISIQVGNETVYTKNVTGILYQQSVIPISFNYTVSSRRTVSVKINMSLTYYNGHGTHDTLTGTINLTTFSLSQGRG